MKDIRTLCKKTISLDEINDFYNFDDYKTLYTTVTQLIATNILKPFKSSKSNGKTPALPVLYRVVFEKEDDQELINEIKYTLTSKFDTNYYFRHLDKYREDRAYILLLNSYILKEDYNKYMSINEKSFDIWGKEKFLANDGGKKILKNLNYDIKNLNFYQTSEPLSYYSHSKTVPQNIVIVENKDTFFSMRKFLLNGNESICDLKIGTLIYGGGKNIIKSFSDFEISVEDYVSDINNSLYYFGDIDYEGILICEALMRIFRNQYIIKPFKDAYIKMLQKYEYYNIDLPITKEGQKRNITNIFFDEFDDYFKQSVLRFLSKEQYIPQEILNIGDF